MQKQIPPFNAKVAEHAEQLQKLEAEFNTDQKNPTAAVMLVGVQEIEADEGGRRINIHRSLSGHPGMMADALADLFNECPEFFAMVNHAIIKRRHEN